MHAVTGTVGAPVPFDGKEYEVVLTFRIPTSVIDADLGWSEEQQANSLGETTHDLVRDALDDQGVGDKIETSVRSRVLK